MEQKQIHEFISLVVRMRTAQRDYHRFGNAKRLAIAIQCEKNVDDWIKANAPEIKAVEAIQQHLFVNH